ncbi:FAD/NAD(P)-binding protein [Streptomyces ossamyceticus]
MLERIAANAPELWDGSRQLHIHLVDPHPPGPGRVWRHGQPALLRMNSMAEDVTMFTDESSTIDGPVQPGPSLAEWAAQFSGRGPRHAPYSPKLSTSLGQGVPPPPADPEVLAELRALGGSDFPSRRAQSAYLDWVFRRALAQLPPTVTVEWHPTTAAAVTGPPDGPQQVHLADRATALTADLVVLAQGHLGSTPAAEYRDHAAFARRHGRFHLPPEFSADADLFALRPGEHVILRGFGLAFIDLMTLLTEGRGGSYRTEADGTLTYLPSGREPVLHVGSRRGVPYHSKTRYRLQGPRPCAAAPLRPRGGRRPARGGTPAGPAARRVAADGQGDRLRPLPRAVPRPPGAHRPPLAGLRRRLRPPGLVRRRDGRPRRHGRTRPGGPARLRSPGPPAGRPRLPRTGRLPGAPARPHRPGRHPPREPGVQRRPRRVPGSALRLRPTAPPRRLRSSHRPLGRRRPRRLVARLLQLPRLRPARLPPAPAPRAVPGRHRPLPGGGHPHRHRRDQRHLHRDQPHRPRPHHPRHGPDRGVPAGPPWPTPRTHSCGACTGKAPSPRRSSPTPPTPTAPACSPSPPRTATSSTRPSTAPTPAASLSAPPPTAGPSPPSPAPAPTRRPSARTTRSPAPSCVP